MRHRHGRADGAPRREPELEEASGDSGHVGAVEVADTAGVACASRPGHSSRVVDQGTVALGAEGLGFWTSWAGGDGAALVSSTLAMPRWEHLAVAGAEGPPPRASAETTPQPVEAPERSDGAVPWRGWERQSERRQKERDLRKRAVAFSRWMRASGRSTAETAGALGVAPRTLRHWNRGWAHGRLAPGPRGRRPRIAPIERQAEVTGFLEQHGPSLSLAALEAEYPEVARAELAALRARYRETWCAAHAAVECRLEWLCPGSVWAMDFTHPPHLIDGVYPAILNVRDLASRHQLLWLAVEHEDAATVVDALSDLFAQHGAPLVMKCDNGGAFRAWATKQFLRAWEVFTLYSPPYCARYNGACERANRSLKELTAHVADEAGRAGFWTSDDLLRARLRANRLTRPWGALGKTPEESWCARSNLSLDKRKDMWQHLKSGIGAVREARQLDATVPLPHYTQAEIERIAAQPVLESLGLLHVTRRRIAPAF